MASTITLLFDVFDFPSPASNLNFQHGFYNFAEDSFIICNHKERGLT